MWILFVLLCVWNHAELWTSRYLNGASTLRISASSGAGGVAFVRPCRARTHRRHLLTRQRQGDLTCTMWPDIRTARRKTWMAGLEATQARQSPVFLKQWARGPWEVSREVSWDEDVERDTSATLSIGGPVVYLLGVEPSVVLPQQFVESWFSGGWSRRVVEARPPVFWRCVGCSRVFQNLWTVCRIGPPVRLSVGGGRVSSAASGASERLESVLERRLVRDRRLAVEDDLSVVGHSSVVLSWVNCVLCL